MKEQESWSSNKEEDWRKLVGTNLKKQVDGPPREQSAPNNEETTLQEVIDSITKVIL